MQHIGGSPLGALSVAEAGRHVPFDVRRVYWLTGATEPGLVRGKHAHRSLQQAIFAVAGAFRLDLDDGASKSSVLLDMPHLGVYLGPLLWHEMRDFSADCVLLVLASAPYDEADYIRDYAEFRSLI